jgi:phage shock protein E
MKHIIALFTLIILFTMITTAKDNKTAMTKNSPVIIDVRTQQEFDGGNIEGSKLIPYDVISSKIVDLVPNKETKIILYCRSGRRSGIAQKTLQDLGYKNVENYGSMESAKQKLGIK